MEDARIAYGLVPVGPTDLAHLMMIEYASTYGNDWFVVPLTLPVGSVTRVDSLVVTDTFGVRSLVRPIGDPALPQPFFSMWQMAQKVTSSFSAAPLRPIPNRFFLPPTLSTSLDSAPLEDRGARGRQSTSVPRSRRASTRAITNSRSDRRFR